MKVLTLQDIVHVARLKNVPDVESHVKVIEFQVQLLAHALANELGIVAQNVDLAMDEQPFEVAFTAATKRQKCPAEIHECDMGGDWDFVEHQDGAHFLLHTITRGGANA